MKQSKWIGFILVASIAAASMSGCGTNQGASKTSQSGAASVAGQSQSAVAEDTEAKNAADRPKFLTVGTGAAGAAFYPIGISVADIVTNQLGIQTTAQVTGGAMENLTLVQENTVDMGITMGNSAQEAYEGSGAFESPYTNISALFGGLSKGYFQVVVPEDSSIKTMADLKGKKVVMGPAGNGAISVAETIWSEYGFGIDDINATYIAYSDGISSLTDGNCDAVVVQAAMPSSSIQELAASGKGFRFLPVEETVAEQLEEKYAYFGHGDIKADVYGTKEDTNTMFITNMMIIRADLDEELVYDITKATFENIDTVKNSHAAAKGLNLEGAVRTSIPLHPGAERYFKEIGALE